MKRDTLELLPLVLVASGVFDLVGGFAFIFAVGPGRMIAEPATHPFFAVTIATFLFSMAFLQFVSSRNVRRYLIAVGAVTVSRVLFGAMFLGFLATVDGFPTAMLPTAIVDLLWSAAYIVLLVRSKEATVKDAFVPVPAHGDSDVPA